MIQGAFFSFARADNSIFTVRLFWLWEIFCYVMRNNTLRFLSVYFSGSEAHEQQKFESPSLSVRLMNCNFTLWAHKLPFSGRWKMLHLCCGWCWNDKVSFPSVVLRCFGLAVELTKNACFLILRLQGRSWMVQLNCDETSVMNAPWF